MANLINNGILPLTFADAADYDRINLLDEFEIKDASAQIRALADGVDMTVTNVTGGYDVIVKLPLSARQVEILLAGGLLNYTKKQGS